jgi:hypothetical protein
MIQTGDIRTDILGPNEEGKYAWWASLYKDDQPHICPLLETPFKYASAQEAEEVMQETLAAIREFKE